MTGKVVSMEGARNLEQLMRSFDVVDALNPRTDSEIAAMLIELWAAVPITAPEAALLEQAIERLKRTGGGALS